MSLGSIPGTKKKECNNCYYFSYDLLLLYYYKANKSNILHSITTQVYDYPCTTKPSSFAFQPIHKKDVLPKPRKNQEKSRRWRESEKENEQEPDKIKIYHL